MARKKKKTKKKKDRTPLFDDLSPSAKQAIWAVLLLVIAVFFVFSLLDMAGLVGSYTAVTLRFLFGAGAWLAPVACGVLIYALLNPREDNRVSRSKIVGTIIFFLSALGGLELYREPLGGIAGKGLTWPLSYLLEPMLTGVLLVGLGLISLFLIFNTGIGLPKRKSKESPADADLEDEEIYDDEEIESVVDKPKKKKEPKEKSLNKVADKMSQIAAKKPSEIVVKNFNGTFVAPSLTLLNKEKGKAQIGDVKANANTIKRTLKEFGISVEMDTVESGPTVTRYALKPAQGVRIARIAGLQQELQLALKASSIRIEAPIPGKSLVGIEVPNEVRGTVALSSMLANPEYTDSSHPLIAALGKDVTGQVHFANIARMPHGLIAGTTGSGKSVSIHNVIISLLFRNSPDQLRFILVDPKRVELTLYNKIPHLLTPVITDAKKAIRALSWAVKEMERRYDILEAEQVQNLASYHKNVYNPAKEAWKKAGENEEERVNLPEALPYIVIVLDELNDLMQAYPRELEASIVRLAQMSRAIGIHLILATQRPSVNVITGTIKANVPTRVALAVASQVDSRTILDGVGAEKLLGKGDMLYLSSDSPKPIRLQSAFVSEDEIKKVVAYLRQQDSDLLDSIDLDEAQDGGGDAFFKSLTGEGGDEEDELYNDAKIAVMEAGKASTSYLQRKLRIGYSRAARLMDLLEDNSVIGPQNGSKPREILTQADPEAEDDDDFEEESDTEEM